jgi:hypothetical protein
MKRLVIGTLIVVLVHGAACVAAMSFDVNKDVHNGTDQPAYGFTIVLRGTPVLIGHYDGVPSKWHFRTFRKSVVSAVEGQTTVLQWSDPLNAAGTPEPMPHCQWVHVGYRLDLPADVLEAYWTDRNGTLIPGGKIPQPTQIIDLVGRTLSVTIKNALRDESLSVTVKVFGYRLWEGWMGLDSLNFSNPDMNSGFTPVPGAEGEITLAHNESRTFHAEIPASVVGRDGPPSLILIKGDPKKEVFVDIAQFYTDRWPSVPPVPVVSQGGLIVMVMLVLAAGAVMIGRHPRHRTA